MMVSSVVLEVATANFYIDAALRGDRATILS